MYLGATVDIIGGLDKIASTQYTSQYAFDSDIYNLVSMANDGHFAISLYSLSIFQFSLATSPLLSVSRDGASKPELYLYKDVVNGLRQTKGYNISLISIYWVIKIKKTVEFISDSGSIG